MHTTLSTSVLRPVDGRRRCRRTGSNDTWQRTARFRRLRRRCLGATRSRSGSMLRLGDQTSTTCSGSKNRTNVHVAVPPNEVCQSKSSAERLREKSKQEQTVENNPPFTRRSISRPTHHATIITEPWQVPQPPPRQPCISRRRPSQPRLAASARSVPNRQ